MLEKKSRNTFTLRCTPDLHPKDIAMDTTNYQEN